MGSRKRAKPNPAAESSASSASATMPPLSPAKSSQPHTSISEHAASATTPATSTPTVESTPRASKPGSNGDSTPNPARGSKSVHKTRSWYGSWPRVPKSAASTQVARETILGGTSMPTATADFSRFESKKSVDSMSIDEAHSPAPTLSRIHEDVDSTVKEQPEPAPHVAEDVANPETETKPEDVDTEMTNGSEEGVPEPSPEQATESSTEQQPRADSTPTSQRPTSGWFGWFGRPADTEVTVSTMDQEAAQKIDQTTGQTTDQAAAPTTEQTTAPEPVPIPEPASQEPAAVEANTPESNPEVQPAQITELTDPCSQPTAQEKAVAAAGNSWLWSWSSRSAPVPPQPEQVPPPAEPEAPPSVHEPEDVVMQDAPAAEVASEPPAPPPKAGSTWAFWSRDTSSPSLKKTAQQEEQGQLAVIGESSESHPKRANPVEFKDTPTKEPPLKAGPKEEKAKVDTAPSRESSSSSKKNKRVRPQSMDMDNATPSRPSTPKVDTPSKARAPKTPTTAKALPPNLLLPSFSGTYKLKENPSIIQQITQLLLRTHQPSAKHVYLTKETPRIKKALAIGVHGLYPANYLRPMIGQPTGTSIKFANHAAEAVRRWADSHGCEDCEIEKVALEGEGRIGERVENLWKLLLNWIDDIRNADLILIGCHSQGVPVSIMLLAKLVELGVVTTAKVGVCAMAGVSLGPFPDYRSSMGILMGSAAELWEFADPKSEVSKRLEASVKVVLNYGARITFVGSIDDQLVPVESAIYAPLHHPYIYRAVFIDGRIHAPDFIAHLVGFALKLRNLGVSDHGLIRELSTPLAGSLYSGEGHSRLYDDEQVYDLAVTHALETSDVSGHVSCEVHHRDSGGGLANPNPYHLPWIMRGLLEEDFVKTELSNETAELVTRFDEWKPVTKALKDVKYRLEAVRSKL